MTDRRKVVCIACGREFTPRFRKGPKRYCDDPWCEDRRESEKRAKDRERKRARRAG